MKIKTIIIDDEPNNIENLQIIIAQHCPDLCIVGTAQSASDGVRLIEKHAPELVLLDIQMPEESGFDLLANLAEINFEVIFVTAFDRYGIQAVKFSALDYLLKPIDVAEFKMAIERAKLKIDLKKQNRNIENLLSYIKLGNREPKIALPTLKETMYIKISDIIRCEASSNYTTFFLKNEGQILVSKTMKEFTDVLKFHDFIRTHQSHLVNLTYVKSFLKEDGGTLLMSDHHKVPISRQNREGVKMALDNF